MTIGNLLNLGAYYFLKYVINGRDPEAFDAGAKPVSPFIMLPVIVLLQTYRNKAKCLKVVIVIDMMAHQHKGLLRHNSD